MRISTAAAFQKSVSLLQERKRKIDEAQEHVSSEKRVLRASDDPVAAARAERARAQIASSESQQRSLDASRSALTQADSALGNASDLVTEAHSAMIGAGNGILSDVDRKNLVEKLKNVRSQLLTLANQGDGAGNYIFGGQGASTPPFSESAKGVVFNGTRGEQTTAGAESMLLTVDGATAWLKPSDGNGFFKTGNVNSTTAYVDGGRVTDPATFFTNTSPPVVADPAALKYEVQFTDIGAGVMNYTVYKDGAAMGAAQPWAGGGTAQTVSFDGMSFSISGSPADGDVFDVRLSQSQQSVFDTLDKAIEELGTPGRTSAQVGQTVQDGMAGLSRSAEALSALRARVGEALVRVDETEVRNGTAKYQAQVVRSEAEDLDTVAALADLQLQSTNYDAALKTYSMVQKLSIFNHIG